VNRFEYVRAKSWEDAQRALAVDGAVAKAAGVDLWDRFKEGLDAPARVVSLEIKEASKIEVADDQRLIIGALATMTDIAEHPEVKKSFAALAEAAGTLATPAIRNAATLGGNLCQRPRCHYFRNELFQCLRKGGTTCFAIEGDNRMHALFDNKTCAAVAGGSTAAPLAALDARVFVRAGAESRAMPVTELFLRSSEDTRREVRLGPGELIERVELSPKRGANNAYAKIRPRESFDWPIVEAAVSLELEGTTIKDARVFLGAVAMVPLRASAVEKALVGAKVDKATFRKAAERAGDGATPLSMNAYKLPVLTAAVERALTKAALRSNV
jgi:xanthine dehydrogenase YagS FAD-binding subunit